MAQLERHASHPDDPALFRPASRDITLPGIQEDDFALTLGRIRRELGRPVKVAFMCQMAEDSSPAMKIKFMGEVKSKSLDSFFEVSAVPWGKDRHGRMAGASGETHISYLSERISEFDVISPILIETKNEVTGIPECVEKAVNLLDEKNRPNVVPVQVKANSGQDLVDAIKRHDFSKVLGDIVRSLKK